MPKYVGRRRGAPCKLSERLSWRVPEEAMYYGLSTRRPNEGTPRKPQSGRFCNGRSFSGGQTQGPVEFPEFRPLLPAAPTREGLGGATQEGRLQVVNVQPCAGKLWGLYLGTTPWEVPRGGKHCLALPRRMRVFCRSQSSGRFGLRGGCRALSED